MSQQQPGRYQRSASGLIVALAVTLLVVGGLVTLRDLFRDDPTTEPEPVDYLATVRYAQEAGVDVVHPRSLPEGWIATSADLRLGKRPVWGLGLLTEDERFVGLRQEHSSLDALLETYVDQDTSERSPATLDSRVADSWRVFEDAGGDRAYASEVGDTMLLVYGSAPREDLEWVVGELTARPLPRRQG